MYDGNHNEEGHFQALNHYLPCLTMSLLLAMIELASSKRWNKSINKRQYAAILYQKEILTNDGVHPHWGKGPGVRAGKDGDWHNGISILC